MKYMNCQGVLCFYDDEVNLHSDSQQSYCLLYMDDIFYALKKSYSIETMPIKIRYIEICAPITLTIILANFLRAFL